MEHIDTLYTSLDLKRVLQNRSYGWNRVYLSRHPSISISFMDSIDEYTNAIGEWDWFSISRSIGIDDVVAHTDRPWNRIGLSMNDTIDHDVIIQLHMPNAVYEWWDAAIHCRRKR